MVRNSQDLIEAYQATYTRQTGNCSLSKGKVCVYLQTSEWVHKANTEVEVVEDKP